MFQHTAARRRLEPHLSEDDYKPSFNTQPPEGGWVIESAKQRSNATVSTHSRPKAAGGFYTSFEMYATVSTHSRPKAAGTLPAPLTQAYFLFQHTAARRRLGPQTHFFKHFLKVSTHSRPKAAGRTCTNDSMMAFVSTHSRPKAAGASTAG